MATIKEVPKKTSRFERVGAHTHVKGLGLDENIIAVKIKDGLVGQEKAREAAGLVVKMIKEGKLSGKCRHIVNCKEKTTFCNTRKRLKSIV